MRNPDATVIAFSMERTRAVFLLQQVLRPDAVAVVERAAAAGYRLAILSGDRERPVAQVAARSASRTGTPG